jgi:hypothetical protein
MSLFERGDIQERVEKFVFGDLMGRDLPRNDPGEQGRHTWRFVQR